MLQESIDTAVFSQLDFVPPLPSYGIGLIYSVRKIYQVIKFLPYLVVEDHMDKCSCNFHRRCDCFCQCCNTIQVSSLQVQCAVCTQTAHWADQLLPWRDCSDDLFAIDIPHATPWYNYQLFSLKLSIGNKSLSYIWFYISCTGDIIRARQIIRKKRRKN